MNTPAKSRPKNLTPTKADLEATVKELRAALEKAQNQDTQFTDLKDALETSHQKEGVLKQQIADLKADVQKEKKTVQKLEKELEELATLKQELEQAKKTALQVGELKQELEQAKKAALQLAETNEKLAQEVEFLKKEDKVLLLQEDTHLVAQAGQLAHRPERPIQKENEKPADFASSAWLL